MQRTRNILFIMFDQLRFDYLSCAGHPFLSTPNIDRIAERGVRFTRTYVQSPICGASRMSTYTGRYVHSHGAAWNNFPLKVGELTLGDHLRKVGMSCWLVGKTHMKADAEGMSRLGLEADSIIGARVAECGFDVFLRDDGLWAQGPDGFYDEGHSPFNEYLKSRGYSGENPWHDYANSAVGADGEIASGWLMHNADKPANVRQEDSETAWLTSRAIDFLESQRGASAPWLCHLSYIKPHWPYIAPAPYHAMYGREQILPVVRDERERVNAHPVYAAFMRAPVGRAFARDEVREKVIPAYMGLIKQCDDEMGRLFSYLDARGWMKDTLIVITSDHGDYLGDHWLGEKNLFHEPSVKVPLIIFDPSPEADRTRGSICDALIEQIDLTSTFIDYAGGDIPTHIVEGHSLRPFLLGDTPARWREFAVSEFDYSMLPIATQLGVASRDARLFMIADKRWKFVHAEGGFRPMLFDMKSDSQELHDLGDSPEHAEAIDTMYERLGTWARRPSQRTTMSETQLVAGRGKGRRKGIVQGLYDGSEIEAELLTKYRGVAQKRYVGS
jgi:arylsulfatase A-like enzyme